MDNNPNFYAQYKLNEQLVNFDKIPENYIDEFMLTIKK